VIPPAAGASQHRQAAIEYDGVCPVARFALALRHRPVNDFRSDLISSPAASPAALPLLYSFRRCPFAMRARMAMLQAARAFRAVEVSIGDKPPAMLALSPKGTVPVLQLPDGQVLEESWDIMRWAWSGEEPDGWWGRAQSAENLDLLQYNDGAFKRHLDRYKYPDRYPDESRPREVLRARAISVLLLPLEAHLESQPYLGGIAPCATDLAIFPFVRQFAAVEPAWFAGQNLPALQAWLAGWLNSRLFETAMIKGPPTPVVEVASLFDRSD
jgi:glutathione S-transferase